MLKENGQQKSLILDKGKTTIALENEFWGVIEYMALEDGHDNWRAWFYANRLYDPDEGLSVAAYVRMKVAMFLFDDLEQSQGQ